MKKYTPVLLLVFLACSALEFDIPNPEGNMPGSAQNSGLVVAPQSAAYTHVRSDGNRYAAGQIDLAANEPLVVPLPGQPAWVLGGIIEGFTVWVVALDNGQLVAVRVDPIGDVTTMALEKKLNPGQPFTFLIGPTDFAVEEVDSRTVRSPGNLTRLVGITPDGDLMVSAEGDIRGAQADLTPLPDGRILSDEQNRVLLLTGPTDRYNHGVLGDQIEAAGFALVEVDPEVRVSTEVQLPEPLVIEGLLPLWTDLNGDGRREIIVTVSDRDQGARLVVYNENGRQVAASDPIGQGNRWRSQTAVAPFGPGGELELADVRTPHLSGTVEFFKLEGEQLVRVAALPGYTTHTIGSRNLDMGIAADVDANGRPELLLPTLARDELAAIQRNDLVEAGAVELWRLPLAGRQITNIGTINQGDHLSIAIGTDQEVLMIWRDD